jgi:beta-phosphoglucomutase-like phosphatase (HAD superfamily)
VSNDIPGTIGDTNVFDVDTTVDFSAAAPAGAWFAMAANEWDVPILRKALNDGIVVKDAPTGILQVTLAPADTVGLTPGRYKYAVKIKEANNRETTVSQGDLVLDPNYVGTP